MLNYSAQFLLQMTGMFLNLALLYTDILRLVSYRLELRHISPLNLLNFADEKDQSSASKPETGC